MNYNSYLNKNHGKFPVALNYSKITHKVIHSIYQTEFYAHAVRFWANAKFHVALPRHEKAKSAQLEIRHFCLRPSPSIVKYSQ